MNFSRTNRYKRIPKPFREHSGTQTWKTRERMRTTPRVILILKQASSAARLHKTLAQKIVVTWWQELREKFVTVVTWWQELQERIVSALTWWQELQERFVSALTWWQELQERFVSVVTWWEELQRRCAMAMTWWQQFKKRLPTAPLEFPQEKKRRRAPQVNLNFVVRIPPRQLKQTRFCWPFSNCRRTVILPMSITTVTESQNCLSPSRQQCPPSTGNQRNLNCLKIYSKRV